MLLVRGYVGADKDGAFVLVVCHRKSRLVTPVLCSELPLSEQMRLSVGERRSFSERNLFESSRRAVV